MPAWNHDICHVCEIKYTDYNKHITSKDHATNIKNNRLYAKIDDIISELNSKVKQTELIERKMSQKISIELCGN